MPGLDQLDGHQALDRLGLLGHPDRAHAALADLLQQLVRADHACRALRRGGWSTASGPARWPPTRPRAAPGSCRPRRGAAARPPPAAQLRRRRRRPRPGRRPAGRAACCSSGRQEDRLRRRRVARSWRCLSPSRIYSATNGAANRLRKIGQFSGRGSAASPAAGAYSQARA